MNWLCKILTDYSVVDLGRVNQIKLKISLSGWRILE